MKTIENLKDLNSWSGELPKVSCLMMTYNRVRHGDGGGSLLDESICSFLLQDYPDKELIVINDTPGQTLVFDHPEVKIINLPERLPTMGHKFNLAVELATGEYITPWDDDDISLPWRLRLGATYCPNRAAVFMHGLHRLMPTDSGYELQFERDMGHAADWYLTKMVKYIGWPLKSYGHDSAMRERIREDCKTYQGFSIAPWINPYLYRWEPDKQRHLSAAAVGEAGYRSIGEHPIDELEYVVQPQWRYKYTELLKESIDAREKYYAPNN